MPRFSIIVPCYDAARTLPATLESLLAQTTTDWECLLVDDGSRDATPAIIRQATLTDPRFRALPNPAKGPSAARNVALTEARGALVAFCDADDIWLPEKLARVAERLGDPDIAAVYARVAFFSDGRDGAVSRIVAGDLSIATLLGENPVCTMSNLVTRRAVFRATGGFDTAMVHNEDLEWLIRLVGAGHRVVGQDETLVRYRTSHGGLSSDLARMRAGRAAALETARRLGHRADARAEAIHLRYLARRALRVDAPAVEAPRLALAGLRASPRGFFSDARRGLFTLSGALLAPLLSRRLRRALFAS
jgi:glycosyltransferase involved in cell wall biosynthesis